MATSILTIHKEIAKKEYAASPLGKTERALTKIYDDLKLKNGSLPESVAKQIYDIRDTNEKWNLAYIERTNKEHREAIDAKLLEAMSKELEILNKHGYGV